MQVHGDYSEEVGKQMERSGEEEAPEEDAEEAAAE